MTVYHGDTAVVDHPLVSIGRDHLDFGKGFYLTPLRDQAEKWARQTARRMPNVRPILNIYNLDTIDKRYHRLVFEKYNEDWLDFIVANRLGKEAWKAYDIIEGASPMTKCSTRLRYTWQAR